MNEENKEAISQPAVEPVSEPVAAPVAQPTPTPQQVTPAVAAQPAPAPALGPQPAPISGALSAAAPVQPIAEPVGYRQPNSTVAVPVSVKPGGTASLVCGILAAALGFFSPIVGVVLGIIAIVQAKKWPGSGKAKAGKVCGIIGVVLAVLSFILGIVAILAYVVI